MRDHAPLGLLSGILRIFPAVYPRIDIFDSQRWVIIRAFSGSNIWLIHPKNRSSVVGERLYRYSTQLGEMITGPAEDVMRGREFGRLRGRIQLIFTSPPFPLVRKKRYGNRTGSDYVEWLASFAADFRDLLTSDGSLVLEMGNTWEAGKPVMSTLGLEALLAIKEKGDFHLSQQFVWHNKARLPSPAQWVNVTRERVTDAFTHIWWMSKSEHPKADNRNVLREYSKSMRQLLERQSYNAGIRPSEHQIGKTSFLADNGGSIPPNVFHTANTRARDAYQDYCRREGIRPHSARMAPEIVEFFVKFLTDPDDVVLDPFAGSNTTGAVCERLSRQWVSIEQDPAQAAASIGRFPHLSEIEPRRGGVNDNLRIVDVPIIALGLSD